MTTKRPRPTQLDASDSSENYEPTTQKRPRHQSDEEWAPQAMETNHSVTNAPIKLEAKEEKLSDQDDWETIETRTVAVDCSHVNLRAHQIR
jgi:hypothetical protein